MLRVGKLTDLTKQQQQQQQPAAGGAGGTPAAAAPGEVLPPVLQHLVNTLAHIDAERERRRQERQQQQGLQQGAPSQCAFRALTKSYPSDRQLRESTGISIAFSTHSAQTQDGSS